MFLKKDNFILNLIIAVFALAIVFLAVNYIEKESAVKTQPSQYPDYDAIKGTNPDPDISRVLITEGCPKEGCKSDRPATQELDALEKQYRVKGRFARAYLYTETIVDYTRPLTAWDDIYFKINGFGGHLIKDENLLPVPPGEISIYLYDLRSISYYPEIKDKENRENKVKNYNLFYLFQDTVTLNIKVFISSDRPGRIMKEVAIYYECYEGSECAIEEIK